MECRIAEPAEIWKLSKLSVGIGNIAFFPGQCIASILTQGKKIVGFAAVQSAHFAAGSWVEEPYRANGHTYELRECLEDEMRQRGIKVYFAMPGNDFEKNLFAKYGPVTEGTVQVKRL